MIREGLKILARSSGTAAPDMLDAAFSTASRDDFYLPVDGEADRPDVETQKDDENSLLSHVRSMIRLRRTHDALNAGPDIRFLTEGKDYPLVYERRSPKERLMVALNPSSCEVTFRHRYLKKGDEILAACGGVSVDAEAMLRLPPSSYAILKLK